MPHHRIAQNCTAVSLPACPVEDTIYGYAPNIGLSAFFVVFFAICAGYQLVAALKWKATRFYSCAIVLGCLGEVTGYIGRILMYKNAYDGTGFKIQISCLIFSPAFIAASIYITLQRLILAFSPPTSPIRSAKASFSLLPARRYTPLFISADFLSLLLQAVGGGLAGSANDNQSLRAAGTNLMIAGVVFQVSTLLVFFGLVMDFVLRVNRNWGSVNESGKALVRDGKFKLFLGAVGTAFITILGRCTYRIAEMVGGWANEIMRDELGFIICEGFFIVIAVLVLTVAHPGYMWPVSDTEAMERSKLSEVESGTDVETK